MVPGNDTCLCSAAGGPKIQFVDVPVSYCQWITKRRIDGSTYHTRTVDCRSTTCKYSTSYVAPKKL
ncbi:hypothetical protein B0H34DRAFT_735210 [Crassisporium funariophilum]|nr:hypothetical protein B0H34DRAFT_735205 [Crassisporium funariophilum]KAF8149172.1 hypothetical protein B0H34DRAFT_735210 [Crassisporium funariophilum]